MFLVICMIKKGVYSMDNEKIIEDRLEHISELMQDVSGFLDDLDIEIPEKAKEAIINIIESKEINEIVESIKTRRPPKVVIMGRSGVGKSSLINAMFNTYLAETSAVDVGTVEHELFQYKKNGKLIFEIIDTRGIKENINEHDQSAEENLNKVIEAFNPDAFLFLTNGADRSTLHEDARGLKKTFTDMNIKPPLITVITRVDEIEPSRLKDPLEFTDRKINNINDKRTQVKQVLRDIGLSDAFVVPVSSYIEWSHEDPESLSIEDREQLTIAFDGRYNIDELLNTLEDNMEFNVALDMMLNHEIEKAIEKIANQLVKKFSNASFLVGASPLPGMDIVILLPIQIAEVVIITYLGGHQVDAKAARDFILSLGAVFLFGFGLRFVAQQGTKLLNVIPGAGSAISGTIAYSGTYSIGKAAISYYINGRSLDEAKKEAEKAKKEIDSGIKDTEENNLTEDKPMNEPIEYEVSIESTSSDTLEQEQQESKNSTEDSDSKINTLKKNIKLNVDKSKESWDKMKTKWPWKRK